MLSIKRNFKKPTGKVGDMVVKQMNRNHRANADWGFSHLDPEPDWDVVDLGCGGGANVARFLELCPQGTVRGLDYSDVSVKNAMELNAQEIQNGRCKICRGNVMRQPFRDASFDLASAFETIYFWEDIEQAFRETWRVLRPGGIFLISNDSAGEGLSDTFLERVIDGMVTYSKYELATVLLRVGFKPVHTYKNHNKLCVIAYKPKER